MVLYNIFMIHMKTFLFFKPENSSLSLSKNFQIFFFNFFSLNFSNVPLRVLHSDWSDERNSTTLWLHHSLSPVERFSLILSLSTFYSEWKKKTFFYSLQQDRTIWALNNLICCVMSYRYIDSGGIVNKF